jgi:hypothetical protein
MDILFQPLCYTYVSRLGTCADHSARGDWELLRFLAAFKENRWCEA